MTAQWALNDTGTAAQGVRLCHCQHTTQLGHSQATAAAAQGGVIAYQQASHLESASGGSALHWPVISRGGWGLWGCCMRDVGAGCADMSTQTCVLAEQGSLAKLVTEMQLQLPCAWAKISRSRAAMGLRGAGCSSGGVEWFCRQPKGCLGCGRLLQAFRSAFGRSLGRVAVA